MSILEIYEGAIYYFDKAYSYAKNKKYSQAMNLLTKGYKKIRDTALIESTKARQYTEVAVNKIQNEKHEEAVEMIGKLKLTVEIWQKNNIIKDNQF